MRSSTPRSFTKLDEAQLATLSRGLRIIAIRSLGDAELADEVVQETLSRAVVALREGRLQDPARLGAFVRGILRHVVTDELRRRGRLAGIERALDAAGDGADALESIVRDEQAAAVRAALAQLPPADQRLIHLCFVDGRTPGEIASQLREPAERVRKQKSRALERLRQAFFGARAGHVRPSTPTVMDESTPIAAGRTVIDG